MLGQASVIKTRNQVKDIPVHQERVFSFISLSLFFPINILNISKIKINTEDLGRNIEITLIKLITEVIYYSYGYISASEYKRMW